MTVMTPPLSWRDTVVPPALDPNRGELSPKGVRLGLAFGNPENPFRQILKKKFRKVIKKFKVIFIFRIDCGRFCDSLIRLSMFLFDSFLENVHDC
jgi:hypothetical protein